MRTLYVSEQGCYLSLQQESILVKQQDNILAEVQLPLIEQILIFGKSQVTTQVIRTCLWREIPIAYLSRMGYCYGRILPISRGYRQLNRYQQALSSLDLLIVAQRIIKAKLINSRTILQRQQRRTGSELIEISIQNIGYLLDRIAQVESVEKLIGFEGLGAAHYFSAFGECISNSDFVFMGRSRRPPGNPVNAMLSFGYQVLWNHLLSMLEIQGLDPYYGCLHRGSDRHAALASDLIEEFRAPIVDSLVLYLINRQLIDAESDFVYRDGGCYLNDSGRKKYLKAFLTRMEEEVQSNDGIKQPKWDLLNRQIKAYKNFVYNPIDSYQPYQIR
jgi:CRISPR-associated protein Cas1